MSQRHPEFNMLNKAKLLPLITCLFQVSISQQMASLFIQLYKSKLPGPTLKPVPPSLLHIQSITKSCWLHVPKSSSVRPFSSVCTPRLRSLLLLLQWSPSSIFRGCELATTVGACKNITFSVFSSSPSWTPAALLAHRDAQWPRSQGQSHQGNSPVITSLVCCHWDLSFPSPHIDVSGTRLWEGCSSIRRSFRCHPPRLLLRSYQGVGYTSFSSSRPPPQTSCFELPRLICLRI